MEPQKFFIGLLDFFSIILPGAIATFLFIDQVPVIIGETKYHLLSDEALWLMFFVSSYLLGHFIFLLGALFLDALVYDNLRKYPLRKQIQKLANGKNLSPKWLRSLVSLIIKPDSDTALHKALMIKEHYLDPMNASSAMNAYQWSKARLTSENPEAMAVVQRYEADSKFFRSLVIILFIYVVVLLYQVRIIEALIILFLIFLALWRYSDQRLKSVTQAYRFIISMEAGKNNLSSFIKIPTAGVPTHAGGLVYKKSTDKTLFLLVNALKNPNEWVLPKGHIEAEENWKETAVREIWEETGVWAKVHRELKQVQFLNNEKTVSVQYYLMEFIEIERGQERRKIIWLNLEEALKSATHAESREILELVRDKYIDEIL